MCDSLCVRRKKTIWPKSLLFSFKTREGEEMSKILISSYKNVNFFFVFLFQMKHCILATNSSKDIVFTNIKRNRDWWGERVCA